MPTGPKGQKRPADVIGNAVKVMRIATGEVEEDFGTKPAKNQAAAELVEDAAPKPGLRGPYKKHVEAT
jgi:hypothetical protein